MEAHWSIEIVAAISATCWRRTRVEDACRWSNFGVGIGEDGRHTVGAAAGVWTTLLFQWISRASQQGKLFQGPVAMLGLIGFALLILACSDRRLSGNWSNTQRNEENKREALAVAVPV
ncbi:hypothetical protein ACJRO7_014443 [Eucalyptus globulus]|uniref:Uncharacterized protein n=1 Tax=Eucalyptus globulus TaxID=34317 RepID=A0ABD3L073_EUCGL